MKNNHKNNQRKITVSTNGPYLVTGHIPLTEKIITPIEGSYKLKEGRKLPQSDEYALCRCGKSQNAPFCDGTHKKSGFNGEETASRAKYQDRAQLQQGATVDLLDDDRCAFARFCHRPPNGTTVWQLVDESENPENRQEAIQGAGECHAGRLTAVDKSGKLIEPPLAPSIEIVQDPEKGVSAGIYVKGNIPIESADGQAYETRNRAALCRCGHSQNKPFCDAMHVPTKYHDK